MAYNRYTLILATALGTAGAATFGVYRLIQNTRSQNQVVLRALVVADQDVPEGAALTRSAVATLQWPLATIPQGAFASIDSVVGRVTRVPIYKGEAIVPGRLAPPGTGPGVQVKITAGKRAMAVRIDDVAGVSGLIQPDSRVDVLVTLREEGSNTEQVSKLFMSNMRVLAVGTTDRSGPDNRPIQATTATLEVTPEEAERLSVAMRSGSIQLVLRGYGDPDSVITRGARSNDVITRLQTTATMRGVKPETVIVRRTIRERVPVPTPAPTVVAPKPDSMPAPVVIPPKPDSLSVQVFRGDKISQHKFEKPDSSKKPDSTKKKPNSP